MCGIAAIFSENVHSETLHAMLKVQAHRGPDALKLWINPAKKIGLGHNRLSILDLSEAAHQPMSDPSGRYHIIFNGEIYNYLELKEKLKPHAIFKTQSDTEVLLAAYIHLGAACLQELNGMFAFLIWDDQEQKLFGARDRFGVKPFYYYKKASNLFIASEIKTLWAAGIPSEFEEKTWSQYLQWGMYENQGKTFWKDIFYLPAGHTLTWHHNELSIRPWYDLQKQLKEKKETRSEEEVKEEFYQQMVQSVKLRFRSDVPVGINLSGGVDSSILLALVQKTKGPQAGVKVFSFITDDSDFDELPWVQEMLQITNYPLFECLLKIKDVPDLAEDLQYFQDEPYGGLPTLAYSLVFKRARENNVIVLLDGNGLDEQWGGYDYYQISQLKNAPLIQGLKGPATRPTCLMPDFSAQATELQMNSASFSDPILTLQYRDFVLTKIPRVLRFTDRISMKYSTELREPFLDHPLVELALRQPSERKIRNGEGKWLLRQMIEKIVPQKIRQAPKRPLQTPQTRWLKGPLKAWVHDCVNTALKEWGGIWLNPQKVNQELDCFFTNHPESSFHIWQWISLGMMTNLKQKMILKN